MRNIVAAFVAALAFFTRIPCPHSLIADQAAQRHAASFGPLVGWVVGLVAALAYAVTAAFLPASVAVLAAIAAAAWLTGGLHEDGLADFCDGFAMQRDREQTLAVMADTHCGAFAVLGVSLALIAKWIILVEIATLGTVPVAQAGAVWGREAGGAWLLVCSVLLAGHALSRFASVAFMYTHSYARPEPDARGRHLSVAMPAAALGFAALCGLGPLAVLPALGHAGAMLAVLPALGTWAGLGLWFHRRIGGYTGDCLGAAQQLTEIAFYLGVCAVLFSASAPA